jgi:4-amino-4-deoxy-L-arabinose transferase-like glycosyltransferase
MPQLNSRRTLWIVILALALCARLGAAVWWQQRLGERRFFFGDSEGYWELARTIAAGEPYQYLSPELRVFRTPGYPVVLSSVFLIYGERPPVLAGRVLGALLGTAAVGLAGWWATLLFDARAGLIAGSIVAFYPGAIALSIFVLSEAPFVPLMLGQLALWTAAWQSQSLGRRAACGAGAGLIAAAAVLMRPSWLLFTPFAIAAGLLFGHERRKQLQIGGSVLAALICGMIPWWVYTARVTGRFVPTTLQVGASLYDGLHAGATGGSDMQFVPEITARERADGEPNDQEIFEARVDRRMRQESLSWAWKHPGEVVRLAGVKLLRMWNVWPNEPAFRGWTTRAVLAVTYVPVAVLGLIGAWRNSARGLPYVLAWLPAVYFTLLHVVFVSSIRYREPAMIALAVLAAGVITSGVSGTHSCVLGTEVGMKPVKE